MTPNVSPANAAGAVSPVTEGAAGAGTGESAVPTRTEQTRTEQTRAQQTRTEHMLTAPPLGLLLRMASPNALAFFVQAGVSMIEAWYIGRLGTTPLAAIALMFPGLMLMQMLSGGAMGGAVTSAIARALGAGLHERAQRLMWHAVAIGLVSGLTFALLWWLFGAGLLVRLGAEGAVLSQALAYGNVLFTGCVLIWLMSILSAAFRGMGDMQYPAKLMVVSAAIQVPLSGALIQGWFGLPQLGIVGAAISVLTVAGVNTALQLARLASNKVNVRLQRSMGRLQWPLFRDILRVGALAALSPIFTVLTIGLINGLISSRGAAAIAGYGIGARMEFLLIPLVFGLGASMTALVGVNIGAGNAARAERIGWIGGGCAAALTGFVGVLLACIPGLWMDLFTDDPETIAAGAAYLQIAGPVYLFQGLGLSLYFASQGASAVLWPVVGTIARFVVSVGGAYLGLRLFGFGLPGVYACIAAGMVCYGSITAAALYAGTWRRPLRG